MSTNNFSKNNEEEILNIWWLGIFLFALAIAAPWVDTSISNHAFVKSYVAIIGSGIIFLVTLYYNLSVPSGSWKISQIKATLLLLFAFGVLSALWSVNFDFSVSKILLWLGAFWCFIIGLNLPNNKSYLAQIVWCLIFAGGTISIIGILQHLFDPFSLTQAAEPASTFGNKNMATQPLVLILPLSTFLLLSKQLQGLKVWILTTLISLICVYIVYTTTRAVWLAISIEIALILTYLIFNRRGVNQWLDWNPNKRNASLFAAALTLILINLSSDGFVSFLTVGPDTFGSIVDSANNTTSPRYLIWQTALNMITDSPLLGSGLGTYAQNLSNEGYVANQVIGYQRVHNDLLELAVELGLVGITLFLGAVIAIFSSIVKILKNNAGETNLFYYLLFVALVGSFVNMQFSFPYQMATPLVLFGLYLGLISKQYDSLIASTTSLNIQINSIVRKISFGLWLLIFTFICATYISWFNMYSKLNDLNLKKEYSDLSYIQTPLYHRDIHNLLSKTSRVYFELNDYQVSSLIDDQILKYWPNHISSLYRKSSGAQKLGNNNEALKHAEMLKKVSPEGLYIGNIMELLVYNSTNNKDKFLQTYNKLLSQSERLLSLDKNTYHFLLFFTIGIEELSKHPPTLYGKYIEHHGYSCEVENNFSIYLFNEEQFENSAKHVNQVLNRDDKCLNPQLIQLLNEKGLINKQDNKIL